MLLHDLCPTGDEHPRCVHLEEIKGAPTTAPTYWCERYGPQVPLRLCLCSDVDP